MSTKIFYLYRYSLLLDYGVTFSLLGAAYPEIPEPRLNAICELAQAMIIDKSASKVFKTWHKTYAVYRKKA